LQALDNHLGDLQAKSERHSGGEQAAKCCACCCSAAIRIENVQDRLEERDLVQPLLLGLEFHFLVLQVEHIHRSDLHLEQHSAFSS